MNVALATPADYFSLARPKFEDQVWRLSKNLRHEGFIGKEVALYCADTIQSFETAKAFAVNNGFKPPVIHPIFNFVNGPRKAKTIKKILQNRQQIAPFENYKDHLVIVTYASVIKKLTHRRFVEYGELVFTKM